MTVAADVVPWVPLVPALLVLLALAVTIVVVRRSRRRQGDPPAVSVPADEALERERDR